ncbi:mycothiol transferase [Rhodococcus tibetensis]|uniref:DinB family protein n=1 Tax=Rhodococcus tibetensis TaxID=2965064 RepID=A0ABT1QBY0_9NOCA|nr:DUF664 domain-containing protein [Rhodococcus sp. FXJ9.536]MCQ4119746.1 DinB family protein [Rhodococcus sp. FXJ9.536]
MGWTDDLRGRLDELLDGYRAALRGSLEGLDDEQARRSPVRSKTTVLGLVKHVTYVEAVWFDQAVTGRSYRENANLSKHLLLWSHSAARIEQSFE